MILLKGIEKTFNHGASNELKVIKDVSLQIDDGEMVAIIGKSGTGKSTLLHILAGIEDYECGQYYLDNIMIKGLPDKKLAQIRNEKIGLVMQNFALVEEFSAIENVLLPFDFAKRKQKRRDDIAFAALEMVMMDKWADQKVRTMSGGQKQRVAIARAMVNQPSVLLADEPTGALDSATSCNIMELFKQLHANGQTIIIVTHDINVAKCCDRIIEMRDGKVFTFI